MKKEYSNFYDFLKIPLTHRKFYLMDIASMLDKFYTGKDRANMYARISTYPTEKIKEIHEELINAIYENRRPREEVLFLNPDRKGIGGKKCSTF